MKVIGSSEDPIYNTQDITNIFLLIWLYSSNLEIYWDNQITDALQIIKLQVYNWFSSLSILNSDSREHANGNVISN